LHTLCCPIRHLRRGGRWWPAQIGEGAPFGARASGAAPWRCVRPRHRVPAAPRTHDRDGAPERAPSLQVW